jgi:hypothetical protein
MSAKKILILVLSFNNDIYNKFYQLQKKTWDNVEHPNIKTMYYFGKKNHFSAPYFKSKIVDHIIKVPIIDTYMGIRKKTILAFEAIKNNDFDYIMRTNSCSYINKINLYKFLENKPNKNFYCGVKGVFENIDFISGAGYILSKDMVHKILKYKNDFNDKYIDDVSLSQMLSKKKVNFDYSGKRLDIIDEIPEDYQYHYHFRFNTGGNRENDFNNMLKLHKKIIKYDEK